MTSSVQIKKLHLTGDDRENGFVLGEMVRESFQHVLKVLQYLEPYQQDLDEIKDMLAFYCPQIVEELKGIQVGLQLSEEKTLQLFSGYDMPKFQGMGCTSVMMNDFYVRNYDFSPAVFDHLFIKQSNQSNWMLGNAQFITGRLDGMNHNGLVVGLHFVNNKHDQKGFLCSMIVRIILEMCSTVDEAIDLLKLIPHAASYNYSLLDRKGNYAIVEASPFKSNVLRAEGPLSCVNMFQNPDMQRYNRENSETSIQRLDQLSRHKLKSKEFLEWHNWFSNPQSPLFYTDYDHFFGTLYTVSYLPKSNQVLLTEAGGNLETITMENNHK